MRRTKIKYEEQELNEKNKNQTKIKWEEQKSYKRI